MQVIDADTRMKQIAEKHNITVSELLERMNPVVSDMRKSSQGRAVLQQFDLNRKK